MVEQALTRLANAFDATTRAGGGTLNGLRQRIQERIALVARELIAGIDASNAAPRGRRGGGAAPSPCAPAAPSVP
jgi:hypothetical protein